MYFSFYTDREGQKRWRLLKKQPRKNTDDIIARSTNIHRTGRKRELELEEIVDYIQKYGPKMLENIQDEDADKYEDEYE